MTPIEFLGVEAAILSGVGLMSAGVWAMLFFGWYETGTLLPYETRAQVRWGPLGLAVAVFFVATTIAGALSPESEPPSLDAFALRVGAYSIGSLTLIGLSQLWLRHVQGLPIRDFGWPTGWEEWKNDLKLGTVATIAVIGPVYVIQIGLTKGLGLKSEHQLINAFLREPRLDVALAVGFAAVITAPIVEELLFRQLAQGWLERLEDAAVGWREPPMVSVQEETFEEEADQETIEDLTELDSVEPAPDALYPPRRSIAGWPFGWLPIAASSMLFALAHLGQGANPISLFFLAIGLGYLYQRTHRIVPCIMVHMLFNAFSMTLVGLYLFVEKQ